MIEKISVFSEFLKKTINLHLDNNISWLGLLELKI